MPKLVSTVEAARHAGEPRMPSDQADFESTTARAFDQAVETFDFDAEITQALDERDYLRAEALFDVAGDERLSPQVGERFEGENGGWARWKRDVSDLAVGALTGRSDSVAGLTGALALDLGVPFVGDLRDVGWELKNYAAGDEVDEIVLGLALVGLAVPAAQIGSDPLKIAMRFSQRSPELTRSLRRTISRTVDLIKLKTWLRSAYGGGDPSAAKVYVRSVEVDRLKRAGGSLLDILRYGGPGSAAMALRSAEHIDHLAIYGRASRAFGSKSRSMFAVLGKRTHRVFRTAKLTAPLAIALSGFVSAIFSAMFALATALGGATMHKLVR